MILDAVALPFALGGLYSAAQLFASLGPYRQVLRRETRPVRAIEAGPVEVAGAVRAKGQPLETLDGTPATAIKTVVSYSYHSGSKTYARNGVIDEVIAVPAELVDDTGSCALDAPSVVLLGESRLSTFTAADFVTRCPALWDRIKGPKVVRVTVEESFIPEGAVGLASGEAEVIEDAIEPGEGYRGERRRRFRLTSTAERPLILSAFPEATARRILLRPAVIFAMLACLWFGVAGTLLAAAHRIGG
jgi:hypothetical protein